MLTTTYADVRNLAAELADRTRDNLPPSEATMLLTFFAAELPGMWTGAAWPELCDNLESVTLDASKCFDKRQGQANEMGDILAVIESGDPRITTQIRHAPEYTELDGRVNVMTTLSTVWVDWQDPDPDLLAVAAGSLNAYTLPARFKLPLALMGASHLLATEDPGRAAQYRAMADQELARQEAALTPRPWWRRAQYKR